MYSRIKSLLCSRSSSSMENLSDQHFQKSIFDTDFLKFSTILSAEIVSYECKSSNSKSSYTVNNNKLKNNFCKDYSILVKTNELEFEVEKRYSQFLELFELVKEKNRKFSFKSFPSKRLMGNFDVTCINQRKKTFNTFLKTLIETNNTETQKALIDFFSIKDNYSKKNLNVSVLSFKYKIVQFAKHEDDIRILNYLLDLNIQDGNNIINLHKIQKFILSDLHKISQQAIKILLYGYGELNGLIDLCGSTFKSSHLVCMAGLKLLCSLLSHEENPEAEDYLSLFSQINTREISALNLGYHITEKPAKNCANLALKILNIYNNSNPEINSFLISQILDNDEAYETFERWKTCSSIYSQKAESYDISFDLSNNSTNESKSQSKILKILNSFGNENNKKSGLFKKKKPKSHPFILKMGE